MFQTNHLVRASLSIATLVMLTACFNTKMQDGVVNSSSSPSESAIATINSLANESEAMNFTLASQDTNLTPDLAVLNAACKASSSKSQCNANNQIAVDWGECAASNGTTLSGGWVNTYNTTNACMNAQNGPLAAGDSVIRTSDGMAIKGVYGGTITWSTNLHLTYDGMTISNAGLAVARYGNTRSITLNGVRRTLEDEKGTIVYDHSILSIGPITMTGARANGTRTITGGTVRVYNNTERFRADSSLNGIQWKHANCCYPTGGTMTSNFSGSKTGSMKLTFNETCGQATLTDAKGKDQSVTLKQCE